MTYLLIDNSNTRTKLCLADKTKLLAWQAWLPTHEIDHPHLAKVLGDLSYDAVLLYLIHTSHNHRNCLPFLCSN